MNNWRTKSWGRVRTVCSTADCLVEYLEIIPSGESSLHRHAEHSNRFTVLEGVLIVTIDDFPHRLEAGQSLEVFPGLWHQFCCPYGAKVIETYFQSEKPWSIEQDIERK